MKKLIRLASTTLATVVLLHGQGTLPYPTEEYFGGGIGYTPMFLSLDLAKAFPFNAVNSAVSSTDLLGASGLGFSDDEISALGNLMVIHGAEGFGNITGHWRIGAYVGLGVQSISKIDSATSYRTDLQLSLATGNSSIELVAPIFSSLEISMGALFGMSRAVIQFGTSFGEPDWAKQFSDSDSTSHSVALSGTFFSFQPYIAMKLQFLNRVGLRMTAGYHIGKLAANKWKLNDAKSIISPSEGNFNAPAVRMMLYIGI